MTVAALIAAQVAALIAAFIALHAGERDTSTNGTRKGKDGSND